MGQELVKYEVGEMVPVSESPGRSLVPAAHQPAAGSLIVPGPDLSADGRRRRPSRWAVLAVAAVLIAGGAAGAAALAVDHGGPATRSAGPADSGDLSGSAAESASARSAAFTLSVTEDRPGTHSTLVSGRGSIDLASHVDQMTASIPAASSVLGGDGAAATVITDADGVYLKVPALAALPGHRSWLEASTTGAASTGPVALAALGDPSRLLALLGAVDGSVTRVGTPQVDGAPTTEYRSTVSVAALAAGLAHRGRSVAASPVAAEVSDDLGVPTVPVTVWVGADGMVRQLSVSLDLNHPTVGGLLHSLDPSLSGSGGPGAGSKVTVTLGLSRYGAPVSVVVPPAAEVVDLTDAYASLHDDVTRLGGSVKGLFDRI